MIVRSKQFALLTLGRRIRHLRETDGYSLTYFAEQIHTSKGYLSKIENGKETPRLSTLFVIAEELNVAASDLIKGLKHAGPFE